MILPKFEYHDPSTLDEACQIIEELREKARPLAGGTDLLVNMGKGNISPENVVSLGRIEELGTKSLSNGQLRLGACVTASELAQSKEVQDIINPLSVGANSLGSPLIRNLATIGGNLVSARPAADLPPSLMAYGAGVVLKKSSGERTIPLDNFFRGPGQTVMEPDELLTEIVIEKPAPHSGGGYIKLSARKALVISLVNVAAFISLDGKGGAITSARVVLGAVAPVPLRAVSSEQVLMGERPTDALFAKAGDAAAKDSKPIDDFRGSAEYRRAMVSVFTRRALNMAFNNAKKSG